MAMIHHRPKNQNPITYDEGEDGFRLERLNLIQKAIKQIEQEEEL